MPCLYITHLELEGMIHSIVTGDMWHVCLEGLKDVGSLCYGWRAEADVAWEGRSRFHPGTVLPCPALPCRTYIASQGWGEWTVRLLACRCCDEC